MKNVNEIFKLIESACDYWLGARHTTYSNYGEMKRGKDDVIFFARPQSIDIVKNPEELSYKELTQILNTKIQANIFFGNPSYPPFQHGVLLEQFYRLEPVGNIFFSDWLQKSLESHSNDIHDYLKLMEEFKVDD